MPRIRVWSSPRSCSALSRGQYDGEKLHQHHAPPGSPCEPRSFFIGALAQSEELVQRQTMPCPNIHRRPEATFVRELRLEGCAKQGSQNRVTLAPRSWKTQGVRSSLPFSASPPVASTAPTIQDQSAGHIAQAPNLTSDWPSYDKDRPPRFIRRVISRSGNSALGGHIVQGRTWEQSRTGWAGGAGGPLVSLVSARDGCGRPTVVGM